MSEHETRGLIVKRQAALTVLCATLAASGCQSVGFGPGEMRRPSGVEGQWTDTGGVGIATFSAGAFTNVATDTGNRLAEGSYTMRDSSTIDLNFRSLIRQQDVAATCLLVAPTQMNCTSSAGAQFTLVRRAAV